MPSPKPDIPEPDFSKLSAAMQRFQGTPSVPVIPAAQDPLHGYLERRHVEELRAAANEINRRKAEALMLYEALPVQEKFHQARCRQRLLRGSNRGGKTLAAMVELARAVTGKDPYMKYPLKDGRAFAVGLDLMHVSQVFYRKLFRPGAFKIIRDEETERWRAYKPWVATDARRKKEAKPAPPLIPQRYIQSIAWEDKGKNIPRLVKFTSGWEITFFSSQAKPPQGMDLDLVLFDEEIEDGSWYPEMAARLLDRSGMFVWSATPQAGNEQLLRLSEMAEAMADEEEPIVAEYVTLLDENPHIDQKEKDTLVSLLDEEEIEVRIGGEFAAKKFKVYSEWTPSRHVRPVEEVPQGWTRVAAVDPGRQICGVLFMAVPPPNTQPFKYLLYDELYIRNCSAALFADKFAAKCADSEFYAFIIDGRMGRQREMGSGKTVESQYGKALARKKVASRRTGSGFVHGLDDPEARIELCRDLLRENPQTGWPFVVVRQGTCPNFCEEIKRYRYKRQGKIVTDVPESRGPVHLMACFGYLAGYAPRYHKPSPAGPQVGGAYQRYLAKLKRSGGDRPVVRFAPERKPQQ